MDTLGDTPNTNDTLNTFDTKALCSDTFDTQRYTNDTFDTKCIGGIKSGESWKRL